MISNLIKNSIDFVPENSGQITLRVEDTDISEILFTVEDNGSGIPMDKADKLFGRFYQIDTSLTRTHGGSGLGLSICKGIVELHNGKIWFDKAYTQGSSFKFVMPRLNHT